MCTARPLDGINWCRKGGCIARSIPAPLDLIEREARPPEDGEFECLIELFSRERLYWMPLGRGVRGVGRNP